MKGTTLEMVMRLYSEDSSDGSFIEIREHPDFPGDIEICSNNDWYGEFSLTLPPEEALKFVEGVTRQAKYLINRKVEENNG